MLCISSDFKVTLFNIGSEDEVRFTDPERCNYHYSYLFSNNGLLHEACQFIDKIGLLQKIPSSLW